MRGYIRNWLPSLFLTGKAKRCSVAADKKFSTFSSIPQRHLGKLLATEGSLR